MSSIDEILERYRESVAGAVDTVDRKTLEQVVDRLIDARNGGRAVFHTGVGKSGHVGQHLSKMLRSVGFASHFICPMNGLHGDLGAIGDDDLIMIYSKSGSTGETRKFVERLPSSIEKIGMFKSCDTTIGRLCDLVVEVDCPDEIDAGFNLMPTSSYLLFTLISSAIFSRTVEKLKISREQYGRNHPCGSIGRSLLYTVERAMVEWKKLPRVNPTETVGDAVVEMVRKQYQWSVVVERRTLVGVVGFDHLIGAEFDRPITDYIGEKPYTVTNPSMKLHQLDRLPYQRIPVVIDGQLVGVIDRDRID